MRSNTALGPYWLLPDCWLLKSVLLPPLTSPVEISSAFCPWSTHHTALCKIRIVLRLDSKHPRRHHILTRLRLLCRSWLYICNMPSFSTTNSTSMPTARHVDVKLKKHDISLAVCVPNNQSIVRTTSGRLMHGIARRSGLQVSFLFTTQKRNQKRFGCVTQTYRFQELHSTRCHC